jgi:hypothetical protein
MSKLKIKILTEVEKIKLIPQNAKSVKIAIFLKIHTKLLIISPALK